MNILMKTLVVGIVLAMGATVNADLVNIIGDSTTTKTGGNFVGPNSAIGNGDFEAETGDPVVFSGVTNWFNLSGDESVNFGRSNGTNGSPQSGSQGAQLSGTTFAANDTGYTILGAGETFSTSLYLGQFGAQGNYGADTTVTMHLFTSTTGVTGTTDVGDTADLASVDFTPFVPSGAGSATFAMSTANDFYTTVAGDIGKTVFLGITLTDIDNNVFPRTDVVSLSVVNAVPEPSSFCILGLLGLGFFRRKRA